MFRDGCLNSHKLIIDLHYVSVLKQYDYSVWYQGQPDNNGGNDDCVQLRKPFQNLWNDHKCGSNLPYVCKK